MGIALWGLHMGLIQGLLAAAVADAAPAGRRGTACFSTKRSILIGAGLEGKSVCLLRASKQISSISPRSSKYNWKGNGPEGVGTLRTLLFPLGFAQSGDDVFSGQFATLYFFHGRSERKAQLRV